MLGSIAQTQIMDLIDDSLTKTAPISSFLGDEKQQMYLQGMRRGLRMMMIRLQDLGVLHIPDDRK